MATARRYPPNRQLTWERLERGWSHDELCAQIKSSMRDIDETDTGLMGNTVRRWETGERWPDPRFRKHLVAILGKSASQLGLLTPDELAVRPDPPEPYDPLERLLTMLSGQTNGSGISRQRLLRALITAGVLPSVALLEAAAEVFEPLALAAGRGSRVDARVVESYTMITAQHRQLYWTAPADALLPSALSHTQLGVQLLSDGAGVVRRHLAGSLAESALLGARLAFFDPARLVSFLGYSQLVAGRTANAVVSLHRALDQLDDRAGKQRSVVLLDLAAAHAATDAEHGMAWTSPRRPSTS